MEMVNGHAAGKARPTYTVRVLTTAGWSKTERLSDVWQLAGSQAVGIDAVFQSEVVLCDELHLGMF